ncbi:MULTISPECIES: TIR domain-containing protein [Pseudomonas]|uniref:Toll/interleukin-1 receptor domain-containing protein n=1 Tax=Pseudomonas monteilii TaxID=76759 RepID=A0A399M6E3_9PSED|nr:MULTISPECIES: toll/interleukin-1 receptor domain-containing protein [Pseudomonas]MCO7055668.1 toll/interleukin-1 receptor domain-containing protein [Pseudomonas juntendi]RII77338.1 hypothetical protein D0894_12040 [Pseudomonas monteilii]UJM14965.1 toll/interleukin-1 receptor domain-containing protein [Pseudomonas juntendi]UXA36416.1 toll/interleukin-1 receptor domain-containing protein [Pseudomonas juntendi]
MYIGLEIERYQLVSDYPNLNSHCYLKVAEKRIDDLTQYVIGTYNQGTILDAEALSKAIFPEGDYDVFLSHSHGDQRNAIDLALALGKHGLKVFVDSTVWGFYGDLVSRIIAQTRPQPYETKESHVHRIHADVHMMLAGALHRTIARVEAFVFVRSDKSVPLEFGGEARTLSPWLYSELQFSFQVQHATPKRIQNRMRGAILDNVKGFNNMSLESIQHMMAFRAFNDHLPTISGERLKEWVISLSAEVRGGAALDSLYSQFDLASEYRRRRESLGMRTSL